MMRESYHKWSMGILILVLGMGLLAACGKNGVESTQNANPDQNVTTAGNNEQDTDNETDGQQEKHHEAENHEQEEKKEVPIYSINDESLESEQTYVPMEEVTPESVVQAVVDSLAEHSLEVGIDSVTMEKDAVIVSFQYGKAPLTAVGSTVEETILNSIADSLLDNVEGCRKVIFRAEGEAYESGHYAFGMDEVYASE